MTTSRVRHAFMSAMQSAFVQGWLLALIAIGLTIYLAPTGNVPLRVFLVTLVVAIITVVILVGVVWKLYRGQSDVLPSLITVETGPVPGDRAGTILVLESSDLFSHDSLVGIYRYARSFERLIGIGYVLTVQTRDQKIQVCVTDFIEPKESDTWVGLAQQNANIMKEVIVKPQLPRNYTQTS
jgi:energy-coupling factor transporter transmembrane protein EcfT